MRLIAQIGAERGKKTKKSSNANCALYSSRNSTSLMSAGATMLTTIRRDGLNPHRLAWDFASIALSAIVADFAELRSGSADGWTRELDLVVPVSDPDLWNRLAPTLVEAMNFLTTDRWSFSFIDGVVPFRRPSRSRRKYPTADCVALLSGGMDSLIGGIDLTNDGLTPYFVTQTVNADGPTQAKFSAALGSPWQTTLNHCTFVDGKREPSQRARSLVFIAHGVLVASSLAQYSLGSVVDLYINENGYISVNPPLTPMRVGSLSTRTAHPRFLGLIQEVLDAAGITVQLSNPYRFVTKGEMLVDCADQQLLQQLAPLSTSCGRFGREGSHCGRCLPCQVRRAAILRWGKPDETAHYRYENLGKRDEDHALFDDVRSVAFALASVKTKGLDRWLGASLASVPLDERDDTKQMLERGLAELEALHKRHRVR